MKNENMGVVRAAFVQFMSFEKYIFLPMWGNVYSNKFFIQMSKFLSFHVLPDFIRQFCLQTIIPSINFKTQNQPTLKMHSSFINCHEMQNS